MDFDFTEETYITAQVLSQWLQDAGCKAKYVLFIINSCYAGMLTEALTASTELHSYPGLYVMAACTANEISVAFNTLGNSIFCYFLSHAISTSEFPNGQFPIKVIYEKCSRLSTALSSLLLGYDKTSGVISKKMHPQLMCPPQTVLEETDMVDMGLRYAAEFYDSTKEIGQLDVKCWAWTEELCSDDSGGLIQLRKEWILEKCIMDTILCFMLRSVARIQLTCNVTSIASGNLFITTFIHIVSAISRVYEIKFSRRELLLALQHYIDCLRHSGIRELETLKELEELLNKIQEVVNKSATQFGEEDTDSGEPDVPRASFSLLSTIERWEPLYLEEYLTPTDK